MGQRFTELNAGAVSEGSAGATLLPVSGGAAEAASNAGDAIVNFGDKLREAKTRSDNNLNTVRRARAFKEFDSLIKGEEARLKTEGDPTDPALPGNFGAFMKQEGNRILGEHREAGANDRSMAKLTASFIELQGSAAGRVGGELAKQRTALVEEGVAANIGALAISAGETNDIVGGFAAVRGQILEAEDVFTPEQELVKTMAGYSAVVTEVFNKRAELRDLDGMRLALDYVDTDQNGLMVTAKEALDSEAYRKLRNRLVQMEYDNDKGDREANELRARAAGILGVDPDALDMEDPDVRELLGLNRDDTVPGIKSMEVAVALWRKVNRYSEDRVLTEEELEPIRARVLENQGLELGEVAGPFGTTLRGLSLNQALDLAPKLAAGQLTDAEAMRLEFVVMEMQRPVRVGTDPITDQPIFANGAVPPSIVDAYDRADLPIPRPDRAIPGSPKADGGQPDGAAGNTITLFDGTVIDPDTTPIAPEQTLYGRIDKLTGVGTGMKVALAENIMGGAVGFVAPEEIKARQDLELFSTLVANALTRDTNIRADTERRAIIEQMDILPTLRSGESLQPKMFAVADHIISIITRDAAILRELADPASQKAAQSEIRNLNYVLRQLGVPRLVTTKADLEGIESGTLVRTPRGNVYSVK